VLPAPLIGMQRILTVIKTHTWADNIQNGSSSMVDGLPMTAEWIVKSVSEKEQN